MVDIRAHDSIDLLIRRLIALLLLALVATSLVLIADERTVAAVVVASFVALVSLGIRFSRR